MSYLSLLGNSSAKILSLPGSGSVKCHNNNVYTRNNKRIVGRFVFYAIRFVTRTVGD
jgi:hypothetical protein